MTTPLGWCHHPYDVTLTWIWQLHLIDRSHDLVLHADWSICTTWPISGFLIGRARSGPPYYLSTFKWHRYRQMKWKKTHAACLFVNAGMFCTLVPERNVSRADYVILKTLENCLFSFAIFTSHKPISWNLIFWELLLNRSLHKLLDHYINY